MLCWAIIFQSATVKLSVPSKYNNLIWLPYFFFSSLPPAGSFFTIYTIMWTCSPYRGVTHLNGKNRYCKVIATLNLWSAHMFWRKPFPYSVCRTELRATHDLEIWMARQPIRRMTSRVKIQKTFCAAAQECLTEIDPQMSFNYPF